MTDESTKAPQDVRAKTTEKSGYAVYDLSLTRFVTGVYPTKAKAEAAAVKNERHKYETREV